MAKSKYITTHRDRITGRLVSKKFWKAHSKDRSGLDKRYVEVKIRKHEKKQGEFRYKLRKHTPKGRSRKQKWSGSSVEVTITSNYGLNKQGIIDIANRLAHQGEMPSGVTVDLVEWKTGQRTSSYTRAKDAQTGFDRFSGFFSEEIK